MKSKTPKSKTSNEIAPPKAKARPAAQKSSPALPTKSTKSVISKPKTKAQATISATKKKSAPSTASKNAQSLLLPHKFDPYPLQVDEDYMNMQQLLHFRNVLNTWKSELMTEVDHTITEMKEASVSVLADPNDRATQEETFNLELRTRDRERKLIRKIEEALNRIDAKEYGYCESCGIEIGIRRLEARPTAVLCIDCKTLDEIRERRTAQ